MKRNIKKRLLTGIAAVALVAPLVLSGAGMNHVNAASQMNAPVTETTSTNNGAQNNNSSQLAAIKAQIQAQDNSMQNTVQQYRQKYQSIPKNDKSQQKALIAQYEKQQKPAQQKLLALQKKYTNTMTPEQRKQAQDKQKAAQKKIMQQLQKQMKAQQAKEKAQMLKTAQSLFLVKGHEVYTVKADITKQGSANPVPGTMKKTMSLRKFAKLQRSEILKANIMARKARLTHNSRKMKAAQNLFMKYGRVGQIPTKKQQQAQAKRAAKAQKNSNDNKARRTNRKSRRVVRRKRGRRVVRRIRHRHTKLTHKARKNRKIRLINHHAKTFNVNENGHRITLLRSEYKRGNRRAATRSGFANGLVLDQTTHTMFSKYLPNSRRAIVPKNYKIYKVNLNSNNRNQQATVWLVGRRTNSIKKINNMKQAYYYGYNNRYGGWRNIGE